MGGDSSVRKDIDWCLYSILRVLVQMCSETWLYLSLQVAVDHESMVPAGAAMLLSGIMSPWSLWVYCRAPFRHHGPCDSRDHKTPEQWLVRPASTCSWSGFAHGGHLQWGFHTPHFPAGFDESRHSTTNETSKICWRLPRQPYTSSGRQHQ
jgi:hypothetical protein